MPSINELNDYIDQIDKITDSAWRDTLSERKIKELFFHDLDRDENRVAHSKETDTYEKFYGNKKYYKITKRSNEYVENWIKNECKHGGVFLDYACGNGTNALIAALSGAELSLGFDISSVSIENAKRFALKSNVKNIRYFQADAENTKLPDGSVDTIICSGMLHHLDLSHAFPELRRILKPGGKVLCVEALDYNPIIKIYRLLTPNMRTDWEKAHILNLKDVEFASRFFDVGKIKYWHVIGYAAGKFPRMRVFLDSIDIFLENVPYIKLLSWIFTFELIKSKD